MNISALKEQFIQKLNVHNVPVDHLANQLIYLTANGRQVSVRCLPGRVTLLVEL